MPIYAYRCGKCGDEVEVMHSMSDAPPKRCRKCKGSLSRVYHPVGIVLKGPGFYKTDSRRPSKTSDEKKTDSKATETSSSSSSD